MDLQLPDVLAANERYQKLDFHAAPRTPQPSRHLVILTCMDARLDLFRALGLEVGHAHILRNAGGRASDDAIRSLVVSTHLLGTREILVIHHTNCGLEGMSDADVAEKTGVKGIEYLGFDDVEESVRTDVEAIRAFGQLPEGTVVWGAVYDVNDGAVRVVAEPDVD
ncbi:MAG: carbonic anhydrase [Actinomycetota bacterium]|jgi:carbonic anhydrase|nr:carbonic anhydrase [Actinomycetota bacterium]